MKTWRNNKTLKSLPALALTFGVLAPLPASANIVEVCYGNDCTITYNFTGQTEPLTFPPNATNIRFEVYGAQGGKSGGGGGSVRGSFTTIPNVLYVTVGGAGGSNAFEPGGFNGGGQAGGSAGVEGSGGGSSDIRTGYELETRIVVAGGGGGRGSGLGSGGGAGGGLVAGNGRTGQGFGGQGGSQVSGGQGGASNGSPNNSTSGEFWLGGSGASGPLHGGGGGGGGYFGGGGGGADADSCCTDAGGGGGGSSYTDPAYVTDVVHASGVKPGAGMVIISYTLLSEVNPAPPTESSSTDSDSAGSSSDETTNPPASQEPPPAETPNNPASSEPVPDQPSAPEADSAANLDSQPSPQDQGQSEQSPPVTTVPNPSSELSEIPTTSIPVPVVSEQVLEEISGFQPNPGEGRAGVLVKARASDALEETSGLAPSADEIQLNQPSLKQSAQQVVVPIQSRQQPWSNDVLIFGLVGIGLMALLAGLYVARRGVPGAI